MRLSFHFVASSFCGSPMVTKCSSRALHRRASTSSTLVVSWSCVDTDVSCCVVW